MNSQHDESTTYGLHVGNKIRNYTPKTRALVQHYINNILFDADMGKYNYCMLSTDNLQSHSGPTNQSNSLNPQSSASSSIDPSDECSNEGDTSSMSNYYSTFSDMN